MWFTSSAGPYMPTNCLQHILRRAAVAAVLDGALAHLAGERLEGAVLLWTEGRSASSIDGRADHAVDLGVAGRGRSPLAVEHELKARPEPLHLGDAGDHADREEAARGGLLGGVALGDREDALVFSLDPEGGLHRAGVFSRPTVMGVAIPGKRTVSRNESTGNDRRSGTDRPLCERHAMEEPYRKLAFGSEASRIAVRRARAVIRGRLPILARTPSRFEAGRRLKTLLCTADSRAAGRAASSIVARDAYRSTRAAMRAARPSAPPGGPSPRTTTRGHGATARGSDELGFFASQNGFQRVVRDLVQLIARARTSTPACRSCSSATAWAPPSRRRS